MPGHVYAAGVDVDGGRLRGARRRGALGRLPLAGPEPGPHRRTHRRAVGPSPGRVGPTAATTPLDTGGLERIIHERAPSSNGDTAAGGGMGSGCVPTTHPVRVGTPPARPKPSGS